MLSLSLNTRAAVRVLAWPRYDDIDDLTVLVSNYAAAIVGRRDVCLCLLHTSEDLPAGQAMSSVRDTVDKLLGHDAFVQILLIEDEITPQQWPEFKVLVQATAVLPSSATGDRGQFVAAIDVTVVRDRAGLTALLEQHPVPNGKPVAEHLPATVASPDGAIFAVDLSDPVPLELMGVELTSKCDLRCVYCPKSDDVYEKMPGRNMDLPRDGVSKAAAVAELLTPKMIVLAGTGETTTLPDWMERCQSFDHSPRPSFNLNSNFARVFSDDEISYLAELDFIQISIDTTDMRLLKEMRRKVNLQTIVQNIVRLRAAVIASGRPGPQLTVHCVLTNKIVGRLHDLAALCVALGMQRLLLLDLYDSPVAKQAGIISILDSDAETMTAFREEIEVVQLFASNNGLHVSMSSTLYSMLQGNPKANGIGPPGSTRKCLQPWESFFVGADLAVYPCCVTMEQVGHLDDFATLGEPEGIRRFRSRMLVGDLPSPCVECIHGEICEPRELQAVVAQKLFDAGRAQRVDGLPEWRPEADVSPPKVTLQDAPFDIVPAAEPPHATMDSQSAETLDDAVARTQAECDRLIAEVNSLTMQRDALFRSRSWRLTQPLRTLADRMRHVR